MPNLIDNRLTVVGATDDVAAFAAAARGRYPRTGDRCRGRTAPQTEPIAPLCFHALVPLPPEYGRRPYGIAGYAAEMDAWGVKWGAFAWNDPVIEDGRLTYRFRTAWRPPTKFLGAVAAARPGLTFLLAWQDADGGPEHGKLVWNAAVERSGAAVQMLDDAAFGSTADAADERVQYDGGRANLPLVRLTQHGAARGRTTAVAVRKKRSGTRLRIRGIR